MVGTSDGKTVVSGSPSATTTSRSTSTASVPRSVATSATVRPSGSSTRSHCIIPATPCVRPVSRPARIRSRTAGSVSARRRSSSGSATTSPQPGMPWSIRLLRRRMTSGSTSATTLAPCAAAWSDEVSCCSQMGVGDALPSRFQLSGRPAASDMFVISSMRSSEISPIAGMNSSAVPGCSRTARASARNSSGWAARDGTGAPSPSECASPSDDEKPIAPPARDSWSSRTISAIWSSSAASRVAASPMTTRRMVEWPAMNAAFTARWPSMRSSHSPKLRQSTRARLRATRGSCPRPAPSCASRSRRARARAARWRIRSSRR